MSELNFADRSALLVQLFRERILIIDGAMGTMIQRHRFEEARRVGFCQPGI